MYFVPVRQLEGTRCPDVRLGVDRLGQLTVIHLLDGWPIQPYGLCLAGDLLDHAEADPQAVTYLAHAQTGRQSES